MLIDGIISKGYVLARAGISAHLLDKELGLIGNLFAPVSIMAHYDFAMAAFRKMFRYFYQMVGLYMGRPHWRMDGYVWYEGRLLKFTGFVLSLPVTTVNLLLCV